VNYGNLKQYELCVATEVNIITITLKGSEDIFCVIFLADLRNFGLLELMADKE
jgi:hypothetical protein